MGESMKQLNLRHTSSALQSHTHSPNDKYYCRSDMSIFRTTQLDKTINSLNETFGEYYKKYEHDEVPVKDSVSSGVGDNQSTTNFDGDTLELKVFKNISQDFINDKNNPFINLQSNIKFFKTTVQNILDNFRDSMQDFEHYNIRFQEIISKREEDAIGDMEDFIKDMIQHIISSENAAYENNMTFDDKYDNENNIKLDEVATVDVKDKYTYVINNKGTSTSNAAISISSYTTSLTDTSLSTTIVQAFKNRDYYTDSISEGKTCSTLIKGEDAGDILADPNIENTTLDSTSCKEEVYDIYLLGSPCVQINIHERNPVSEINIKKELCDNNGDSKLVASADNFLRRAAKRTELKKYGEQETNCIDYDIPIKISVAKPNIPYEDDFTRIENKCEKSFIFKLCEYFCRKFRRI